MERLSFHVPRQPVRQVALRPDKAYLLGRAPECDICLDDTRLSRRHARLACRSGTWKITDLNSKNGVLVDGKGGGDLILRSPAWISFGGVMAQFETLSDAALSAESAQRRRRWDSTFEMGRALDPLLGLDRLLNKLLDSVMELTGLERGFVLLSRDDGNMEVKTSRHLQAARLRNRDFNGSWGAIGLALESRRVVAYGDASASSTLGDQASVIEGEIRALVCVPLLIGDKVHGAVYSDSPRPGKQITELDVELLDALGGQASTAVGIARVKGLLDSLQMGDQSDLQAEELARVQAALNKYVPVFQPAPEAALQSRISMADAVEE